MSLLAGNARRAAGQRDPAGPYSRWGLAVEAGRFHCNRDQAASFPDALATWVAIASIKAGDRQS